MAKQNWWLFAGGFVIIAIVAVALWEFRCLSNRQHPLFSAETLLTEKELRAMNGSPDEDFVTAGDAIRASLDVNASDVATVRHLSRGAKVRVLVWRYKCLLRSDSLTAFLDPQSGRVLHITAAYRL